jgi:hypothetical protein
VRRAEEWRGWGGSNPDLRFRKTPKIFLTAFLGRDGSVGFVGRMDGEFMMDAACESQPSAVKVWFKGDG